MLSCDQCTRTHQFAYKTFFHEYEEGKRKLVTWCEDCLGGRIRSGDRDKQLFEHISTPYWKLMGLKPKPHEVALEQRLKDKNMTYGDLRRARALKAKEPSAAPDFQKHVKQYGTKNAPERRYNKA